MSRCAGRMLPFILTFIPQLLLAANGGALDAAPTTTTQNASLAMAVTATGVRVDHVTPGGQVVLLFCAKRTRDGANYLETNGLLLRDADNDGVVTHDAKVPLRSVWVAVDLTSGATASGAHPQFPLHVTAIAPAMFRKDAASEIVGLERQIPRLILCLVRPRLGAWMVSGRDGGRGDRDEEANGRLNLRFEDARPVGDGKENAPKHLKNGDVIVAIDPGRLDVFLGEVTK